MLTGQDLSNIDTFGLDETSVAKGHDYIFIILVHFLVFFPQFYFVFPKLQSTSKSTSKILTSTVYIFTIEKSKGTNEHVFPFFIPN